MRAADTIAAVATAPGAGGVGIVRVSGAQAGTIAQVLLGRTPRPRHAHYTTLCEADGALLDQGLLLWFPAPHSYTGEDVLELHAHGSPILLDLLLRRVCALGARPARAGEFSERAYLNGKLDLMQAEAIAELIAAGSDAAVRAAQRALAGVFSTRVGELQALLTRARAHIEAALDFPDEDLELMTDPALLATLTELRAQIGAVLLEAQRGVRLAQGLSVVLIGRPNTGKSSLLNALAGEDRAIVTAVPGTTRDVLRVDLQFDGVRLELADTAGFRDAGDAIEREGMRRAEAALLSADLALLVSDAAHWTDDYADARARAPDTDMLVVLNKIDLIAQPAARIEDVTGTVCIALSACSGSGVDLLRQELHRRAGGGADNAYSARTRHVLALQCAAAEIDAANIEVQHAVTRHGGLAELAAEALRRAQQALDELTGAHGSEELLGAIFSSFCIGK